MFSIEPTRVREAADALDAIAETIRTLKLSPAMDTVATALPDTINVTSPVPPAVSGADETINTAVTNAGGQVEAFGALVRTAADTTEATDEDNAEWFVEAGELPSVAAWDPMNQIRPADATG